MKRKPTVNRLNDSAALDAIAAVMSRAEWSADTLDDIAFFVRSTHREIADLD